MNVNGTELDTAAKVLLHVFGATPLMSREKLRRQHAVELGASDPDAVVKALAEAHHKAVAESMESAPAGPDRRAR